MKRTILALLVAMALVVVVPVAQEPGEVGGPAAASAAKYKHDNWGQWGGSCYHYGMWPFSQEWSTCYVRKYWRHGTKWKVYVQRKHDSGERPRYAHCRIWRDVWTGPGTQDDFIACK